MGEPSALELALKRKGRLVDQIREARLEIKHLDHWIEMHRELSAEVEQEGYPRTTEEAEEQGRQAARLHGEPMIKSPFNGSTIIGKAWAAGYEEALAERRSM